MAIRRVLGAGSRSVSVAAVCAVVLAAYSSASASSASSSSAIGRSASTAAATSHVRGGTITWAQPPEDPPNWIFPFTSYTYFSDNNDEQFQYLMYRPLYWFGQIKTAAPSVDEQLSLAKLPVFSNGDKTITITMKGWKYSNGQVVDAQSVVFWMNMMKDDGTVNAQWGGYVPGGYPDNIKSYSTPHGLRGNTVVFHLTKAYNPTWYLYNELSQITPMPEAWDVTSLHGAPGSGGCAVSTDFRALKRQCTAVWSFDTDDNGKSKNPEMAGNEATYATNKLWQVVDGPWRLTAFSASNGRAVFAPNPKYSGPQKPIISRFIEEPFSSDTTEYGALEAGGSTAPDVGYIPAQDIPRNTGPLGSVGANAGAISGSYTLSPVYPWEITYIPENYDSTGDNGNAGPIFRQLYFREALQMGVNQPGIVSAYDKGYAVPLYGPVPVFPKNPFASPKMATNPTPFDPAKGKSLLLHHGWKIVGGVAKCVKPGSSSTECGSHIKPGALASFTMDYPSGSVTTTATMDYEASSWAQEGIVVHLISEPLDQVDGVAVPCPTGCAWEMANWGAWHFSPDYLPTGEENFVTNASSNAGSYTNPVNDRLINETNVSSSSGIFTRWENYLASQLPVIWQPNTPYELAEISTRVGGVEPINSLLNLTPEYWYLKK